MKRSTLNEIQGVLVTANRSDLAEKMVVAKGGKGKKNKRAGKGKKDKYMDEKAKNNLKSIEEMWKDLSDRYKTGKELMARAKKLKPIGENYYTLSYIKDDLSALIE